MCVYLGDVKVTAMIDGGLSLRPDAEPGALYPFFSIEVAHVLVTTDLPGQSEKPFQA